MAVAALLAAGTKSWCGLPSSRSPGASRGGFAPLAVEGPAQRFGDRAGTLVHAQQCSGRRPMPDPRCYADTGTSVAARPLAGARGSG